MKRLFLILMILIYLVGSGAIFYKVFPSFRRGGNIELVVLLDHSASFKENISVSNQSAAEVIRALSPQDTLGVIGFGETVKTYFNGKIETDQALNDWVSELQSLSPEAAMLTDLPKAIDEANRLFEQFADSSQQTKHRLVLLFSDAKSVLEENVNPIPYLISPVQLMAVGFRSRDNDLVTRRLLGVDGKNDIIITPIDDIQPAIQAMKEAITHAHPLQISKLTLFAGILVLGLVGWIVGIRLILSHLEKKSEHIQGFSLRQYGQDESEQTFSLGDFDSIAIGNGICDYSLPCKSKANITRENNSFHIVPDENADIAIEGERINNKKQLSNGDNLVIDGYLQVQIAW